MAGDNGAADPIRRAIAEQVDRLRQIEPAVRADADDAVHQMRVAIRRIRSLLRAAPHAVADSSEINGELRWLAGVLGTARDAEVLAQRYRRALNKLAPSLVRGLVVERLVDGGVQRYRAGWAESVAALDSPRYRSLLARLDALSATPTDGRPDGSPDTDIDTVHAAYRRVRKAAKATRVGGTGRDDAAPHRIRKAAKRLRYTAAAMGASSIEEQAKAIQTLLGEHQDSVVSRAHLLAEAAAAEAAGEDTFTYGLLYQQERDIAHGCRARLDQALDELAESMATLSGGRAGL